MDTALLKSLRRLERAAANMQFSDTFVGERPDDMMVNTLREIGMHKELFYALEEARAAIKAADQKGDGSTKEPT